MLDMLLVIYYEKIKQRKILIGLYLDLDYFLYELRYIARIEITTHDTNLKILDQKII